MCGITGFVLNNHVDFDAKETLLKMADLMKHRGPDESGYYEGDKVYLAHRRLSIIDLKSGQQPMFAANNKLVIVYNGEIYNFREIRKELEGLKYHFETNSDTEVLLKAYEEWEEKCLLKFIGMFAFAIYDERKDLVFLARDRLGIKPFYYAHNNKAFVFASEIKPLLLSKLVEVGVDQACIDHFITLGYVPGNKTMFKGIEKLKPGHYAKLKNGKISIKRYWSLGNVPSFSGNFEEACEMLVDLLRDSISLRLISDVPVGVFLSGGLDSASVVATICEKIGRSINTFSIGYEDFPEVSELDNARIIAQKYNTIHHERILRHRDFFESMDHFLNYTEEPLVESAAIALMQLSKFAREHATVLLSGEGADEVFAGYPIYQLMPITDKLRHIFPRPVVSALRLIARAEKHLKYLDWIGTPLGNKYKGVSNDVTPSIKNKLYQKDFLRCYGGETENLFQNVFGEITQSTNLQRMQYVDLKTWLPDDLLLKADKMTMAVSIELRVPFLDHRMVEFGYSLPDKFKINKNQRKYLLKKVMENMLPHKIIFQKKKGFPVPISQWFRQDLHSKIKEILLDCRSIQRGYFKPAYIEGILDKHKSGKEDMSRRIFSLLVLELWHQKFIDSHV
jgi:asparagine synthase (glutamine-hydrolysing)